MDQGELPILGWKEMQRNKKEKEKSISYTSTDKQGVGTNINQHPTQAW